MSRPARPTRRHRGFAVCCLPLCTLVHAPDAAAQPTDEDRSPIDEPLRMSGPEIEVQFELRAQQVRGQDEPDRRRRDVDGLRAGVELDLRQRLGSTLQARASLELQGEQVSEEEALDDDQEFRARLRALYLQYRRDDPDLRIRLGRQGLEDDMSWFIDEDVDGLRIGLEGSKRRLDLSVSRLSEPSIGMRPDDEGVNLLAALSFDTGKSSAWTPWVLYRDEDDADSRATWLGLQGVGRTTSRLRYWFNAAARLGEQRVVAGPDRDLRGFAVDLGATRVFDTVFKPTLSLGLAHASGDPERDDGDDGFRQTGLHRNQHRFGGKSDFRYLGEVLDPELANIGILTVGLGARPLPALSVDLVYHAYRQSERDDDLRGSDLEFDPLGESDELGDALDLIVAYEDGGALEVQAVAGLFQPGAAFADGTDDAWLLRLELEYTLERSVR